MFSGDTPIWDDVRTFVSIPDRVLGVFRLAASSSSFSPHSGVVSIPDRVLGVFRLGSTLKLGVFS